MTLMTTKGINRCTEAEARAVPEPPFTDTWHPIGNDRLIDALSNARDKLGVEILDMEYSIGKGRMFGVWTVKSGYTDKAAAIGFRNSTNRSMAAGICAGSQVFVCSNLAFSAEFVKLRKHTSGITAELSEMCIRALEIGLEQSEKFLGWQDSLKEIEAPALMAKSMTFDLMAQGVLPGSQFNALKELYFDAEEDPEARYHRRSLYSFHGAVAQVIQETGVGLDSIARRTAIFTVLVKAYLLSTYGIK